MRTKTLECDLIDVSIFVYMGFYFFLFSGDSRRLIFPPDIVGKS